MREISQFVFGLQILKDDLGKAFYRTKVKNTGVPVEIAILQLELYLNKMRENYKQSFNK